MTWTKLDVDKLALPDVDLTADVACARAPRGCPDPAVWSARPPCGHTVRGCDACRDITDVAAAIAISKGETTTTCHTCAAPVPLPITWSSL